MVAVHALLHWQTFSRWLCALVNSPMADQGPVGLLARKRRAEAMARREQQPQPEEDSQLEGKAGNPEPADHHSPHPIAERSPPTSCQPHSQPTMHGPTRPAAAERRPAASAAKTVEKPKGTAVHLAVPAEKELQSMAKDPAAPFVRLQYAGYTSLTLAFHVERKGFSQVPAEGYRFGLHSPVDIPGVACEPCPATA